MSRRFTIALGTQSEEKTTALLCTLCSWWLPPATALFALALLADMVAALAPALFASALLADLALLAELPLPCESCVHPVRIELHAQPLPAEAAQLAEEPLAASPVNIVPTAAARQEAHG